ncbi:MAG: hypothetical protein H7Z19_15665 [Chitinophagaceae bacterium]|nr:hypothetical protein [Rubrivivax sp.]
MNTARRWLTKLVQPVSLMWSVALVMSAGRSAGVRSRRASGGAPGSDPTAAIRSLPTPEIRITDHRREIGPRIMRRKSFSRVVSTKRFSTLPGLAHCTMTVLRARPRTSSSNSTLLVLPSGSAPMENHESP